MKQNSKIILTILIIFFILLSIFSFLLIVNELFSWNKNKTVKYKGTDEDIVQYVKDTHGIDVVVEGNHGPKRLNETGGAVVRTTDERKLVFQIEISMFNNIKSDTYLEESGVYSLNEALRSSNDIENLKEIGAISVDIQLPKMMSPWYEYNPFFYFFLSEEIQLSSQETVDVVKKVLPVAEKWKETAMGKYQLHMDDIRFTAYDKEGNRQVVQVDITKASQDSSTELEKRLLSENKDAFTQHLVAAELKKIAYLEDQFDILQFSERRNKKPLACSHIQKLNDCESYTLFVSHPSRSPVELGREFRYDDPLVKELLFDTIQKINHADSPIHELSISMLYRPLNLAYQYETEEVLQEKSEKQIHFVTKETIIKNLPDIKSVEDIQFSE